MLVLIDTKTNFYKRYSGKTCVLKVQSDRPLNAAQVELFRVRPEEMVDAPAPEAA